MTEPDVRYIVTFVREESRLVTGCRVRPDGAVEYWGRADTYDEAGRLTKVGPTTVNCVLLSQPDPSMLARAVDWAVDVLVGPLVVIAAAFALVWLL